MERPKALSCPKLVSCAAVFPGGELNMYIVATTKEKERKRKGGASCLLAVCHLRLDYFTDEEAEAWRP